MPSRRLVRAFIALWWTLGIMLFVWSFLTVRGAVGRGAGVAAHPHMALLGGIEAVAALLFLIPRTLRVGAAGLLFAFAVAFLLHAAQGSFRGDLILDAAAVLFVAVHGPVPWTSVRAGGQA